MNTIFRGISLICGQEDQYFICIGGFCIAIIEENSCIMSDMPSDYFDNKFKDKSMCKRYVGYYELIKRSFKDSLVMIDDGRWNAMFRSRYHSDFTVTRKMFGKKTWEKANTDNLPGREKKKTEW